jgi:hypothetical protein
VNEGVNIPPRAQLSPLGARGEVKNGPQAVTNKTKNIIFRKDFNFEVSKCPQWFVCNSVFLIDVDIHFFPYLAP